MKTIRSFFFFLALAVATAVAGQSVNESLQFDEKIHDFGVIEETAGKVTHRFRFTNAGKEPAVLLNARAGCSCVKADVPKQPVKPGESAYVTVTFDPDYRPGHFSKEIVVYSAEKHYNRIWIKGDVKPGKHPLSESYRYDYGQKLLMNYQVMNFGKVKTGTTDAKTLKFANDSDRTLNLDFESDTPEVSVTSGCILRPRSEGSVSVTVAPSKSSAGKSFTARIYPVVNGKRLSPLEVNFFSE